MNVKRSIRWTLRALNRLDEIVAYIAKDNPTRAVTFVKELQDKINILKTHQLGTAGRVPGTKELVLHKNYLAVYRIKNKAKNEEEVQIITILHAARNR